MPQTNENICRQQTTKLRRPPRSRAANSGSGTLAAV